MAVHRATALLLDEARAPAELALRFLPWLLAASPADSLAVLKVLPPCLGRSRGHPVVLEGISERAASAQRC